MGAEGRNLRARTTLGQETSETAIGARPYLLEPFRSLRDPLLVAQVLYPPPKRRAIGYSYTLSLFVFQV